MTTSLIQINGTISLDPISYPPQKTSTFIQLHQLNLFLPSWLVETHDAQYIAIANFMYLITVKHRVTV